MINCHQMQKEIKNNFQNIDTHICKKAIVQEVFSLLRGIKKEIIEHLETCSDCTNDVLWYLEIREICDFKKFPCLHIAYACNNQTARLVSNQNNVFSININGNKENGIVIGYCPWCGIKLNVDSRNNLKYDWE